MSFPSDALRLVHLWIVAPATLVLVFLIGPLGAGDEQMHLFRADAISHGVVAPRVIGQAPARGAGGQVDTALETWVARFAPQPNSEIVPTSRRAMRASMGIADAGTVHDHIHSNTAIYPPLLYGQSALAILAARETGLPVASWLYAARLANALVAIGIFAALMRSLPAFRPLLLIVSALPIMLYQTATVSADAVLLPVSVAFACLLVRLFVTVPSGSLGVTTSYIDERTATACLALAMIVLCVGKVAYLPFAILPPLAARVVDGRWSSRGKALAAMALLSLLLWAWWAWIVHDKVFTIRPDIPVDPIAQLKWMLAHPLAALGVFGKAFVSRAAFIAYSAMGSHLGELNFRIAHTLVFFALIALVVAMTWSSRLPPIQPRWFTGLVWLVAAAVAIIVPLLLYLQFNAVGQSTIEGIQGRYFLPAILLVIPFVPRTHGRFRERVAGLLTTRRVDVFAAVFAVVSAAYMVWRVSQSYWTA